MSLSILKINGRSKKKTVLKIKGYFNKCNKRYLFLILQNIINSKSFFDTYKFNILFIKITLSFWVKNIRSLNSKVSVI